MADADVSASRSVALELREERRLVQEGYDFLDEKRVLLATEILKRLAEFRALRQQWSTLQQHAAKALLDAAARHGLEGLSLYPVYAGELGETRQTRYTIAGVALTDDHWVQSPEHRADDSVDPSPEARTCAKLHLALLQQVLALASTARNLRRLAAEYRRTERRARALESVLIPELDSALHFVEEQLELYELEEATRVHEAKRRQPR